MTYRPLFYYIINSEILQYKFLGCSSARWGYPLPAGRSSCVVLRLQIPRRQIPPRESLLVNRKLNELQREPELTGRRMFLVNLIDQRAHADTAVGVFRCGFEVPCERVNIVLVVPERLVALSASLFPAQSLVPDAVADVLYPVEIAVLSRLEPAEIKLTVVSLAFQRREFLRIFEVVSYLYAEAVVWQTFRRIAEMSGADDARLLRCIDLGVAVDSSTKIAVT